MTSKRGPGHDPVKTYADRSVREFSSVAARLPIRQDSMIQLEKGEMNASVALAGESGTFVYSSRINVRSTASIVVDPSAIVLTLPVSWHGVLFINGHHATNTSLIPAAGDGTLYIRGGRRSTVSAVLPRETFIGTIAALRGIGPEEMGQENPLLVVPPAAAARMRAGLRRLLQNTVRRHDDTAPLFSGRHFADTVFELAMDSYLCAQAREPLRARAATIPSRVVRAAEDHFVARGEQPVSLADLCKAAGVGQTALYHAFRTVCGLSPIAYFHKRRLGQIRSRLLRSVPQRGAIKMTALDFGFTELGRFSGEYRQLFGETPSATLARDTRSGESQPLDRCLIPRSGVSPARWT